MWPAAEHLLGYPSVFHSLGTAHLIRPREWDASNFEELRCSVPVLGAVVDRSAGSPPDAVGRNRQGERAGLSRRRPRSDQALEKGDFLGRENHRKPCARISLETWLAYNWSAGKALTKVRWTPSLSNWMDA
ncbi:hypothetical protein D3C72_1905670 [compost metagenome]